MTALGKETIWVAADRRLSYGPGRAPIDDAMKVLVLDSVDGKAVFAYAGLGATSNGMQPSTWLRNVLRGRSGKLEDYLGLVADKVGEQFPRHLSKVPGGAHVFLVPAFIGRQAAMFAIECVVDSFGGARHRYTRLVRPEDMRSPATLCVVGSGARSLARDSNVWGRSLLNLIRDEEAHGTGTRAVADGLAELVHRAHLQTSDGSVGPRSVVVWARAHGTKRDGGGHAFYEGVHLDPSPDIRLGMIPSISNGTDFNAVIETSVAVLGPIMEAWVNADGDAEAEPLKFDPAALNEKLEALADSPDDRLR
ncbi:hypothetical protein ACFQRL_14325 [Microbacterium fluvii]|uniref:Uncharacterized protein n=1 Tax=Microbacterium fluvii TaxID=415215 RepID=A0ABW2HKD3_9MICO|nr:hypothetical protein [Microbacterium fluvii]MCU4673767.1 hypothetical protein [Microbacterium fluvii]